MTVPHFFFSINPNPLQVEKVKFNLNALRWQKRPPKLGIGGGNRNGISVCFFMSFEWCHCLWFGLFEIVRYGVEPLPVLSRDFFSSFVDIVLELL